VEVEALKRFVPLKRERCKVEGRVRVMKFKFVACVLHHTTLCVEEPIN
jgi:hypothetical protein